MASWRCWFLFQYLVFWISDPKSIFGQILAKKSKLFVLPENWYTCYLEVSDSCSNINFLNFKTKIHFCANLDWKTQSCPVWLKIGIQSVSTMLVLIPTFFSQFSTLNPFLDKFGEKNSKLFILTENCDTWYIKDADSYSNDSFLNCQP